MTPEIKTGQKVLALLEQGDHRSVEVAAYAVDKEQAKQLMLAWFEDEDNDGREFFLARIEVLEVYTATVSKKVTLANGRRNRGV